MKRIFLAILAILAMTTPANAQWFSRGCANGQCATQRYSYSRYSYGCANGQCGLQYYGQSYGQCSITSDVVPEPKTIVADDSSEPEDEYNSTPLDMRVLKVKTRCVECNVWVMFDYTLGNHDAYCPKCGHMYMVKNEQVFSYVRKRSQKESVAKQISNLLAEANAIRAQYGLAALTLDVSLESGSTRQASFCSRIGRLQHAGGIAEILAQNTTGFAQALSQWLNSPGHRALLLNPNFRLGGAAMVRDSYGRVWCAMQFR